MIEQHGSISRAAYAEASAERDKKASESFIYSMFHALPDRREFPRDLERVRQATWGQLSQLERVAMTPAQR